MSKKKVYFVEFNARANIRGYVTVSSTTEQGALRLVRNGRFKCEDIKNLGVMDDYLDDIDPDTAHLSEKQE